MDSSAIHVLVVDGHPIVRQGVRCLLAAQPEMELVGEAADGVEALALVKSLQPDVVLMDIVVPRMDGIEAIEEIKRAFPTMKVLVLTSCAEDEKVLPAIRAGVAGYLLKDTSTEDLLRAIREVHRGHPAMHPLVARRIMQELRYPAQHDVPPDALTEREVDVLKLLAQGLSNEDIAARLYIGERTARTHVSNILQKLHLSDRTQARFWALQQRAQENAERVP